MIHDLRPYPAYKDSGTQCLGEVPEHWEILPLKRVTLSRCDGPFGSGLKSSHYTDKGVRVIRLQNIGHAEFKKTDAAYISLEHSASLGDHSVTGNDLLIAGLGDDRHPAGRACVAPAGIEPAIVKADCFRFRLNLSRVIPDFAALHLTATAESSSAVLSTGATRQRTNLQSTAGRAVALPSLSEQSAIVRFISDADRRFQRYIRAKKKLIALLNEQKQAIIHRAVTRGLDPNVRLKPSGVEWLGDIPEHWKVHRAKILFKEVDNRSITGTEILLSLRMYRGLVPHNDVSDVPIAPSALVGFKRTSPGQIVMNRMRAAIGMFGIARQAGLVSPDYAVLRASDWAEPEYYLHVFKTRGATSVFRLESRGLGTGSSGFMRLYMDRFGIIKFPVPPIEEQRSIVRKISAETVEIDKSTVRFDEQIVLLREYRTRLIADVVTGKLDVREAAARRPEEIEGPELHDDEEALEEDDEEAEGENLDASSEEATG